MVVWLKKMLHHKVGLDHPKVYMEKRYLFSFAIIRDLLGGLNNFFMCNLF